MPLLQSKASCFIDACEIAFDVNAQTLARDYRDLCGETDEHDPDVDGYHTSIVNMALLERYGRGLTEIDVRPTIQGYSFSPDVPGYVTDWFKRPHLQAVCTGKRDNGEAHAIAYRNGSFLDSDGLVITEPNITIQYVWVLGLPAFVADETAEGEGETA